jgi:xanthine dehydrogenase small subunit
METFLLNADERGLPPGAGVVLLDVVRRDLGLTGTKEGCREGDCGACAVLLGTPDGGAIRYAAVCSCLLPAGDVAGRHVVTIEGLNAPDRLTPVQQALVDGGGIQCGFCTPGLVVALTGHLLSAPRLDEAGALASLAGNLCRCTGYAGIRRAVGLLMERLPDLGPPGNERIARLIDFGAVPEHFRAAPQRLAALASASAPQAALRRDHRVVVGGGTDLFVTSAEKLQNRPLRFLGREPELTGISVADGVLSIGAATTVAELTGSPELAARFPTLRGALALFASPLIRNRATVAGNLVNASPIGDLSIALLALGAKVVIQNDEEIRTIELENLYLGYKQLALREGEIVARVEVPLPAAGARFRFEKVSRRRTLDIASVNAALAVVEKDGEIAAARLSAGGVAPVPLLLRETSGALVGRPVSETTVREAAARAAGEIEPISDVRGAVAYKALLLGRLVRACFAALFPDRIAAIDEEAP